jgi:hypothetical protein
MLPISNLQNPFEVEMDASEYATRTILMQGGEPIHYRYKMFLGLVLNYLTYDKELYALVQIV